MDSARTIRKGIRTKDATGHEEESCTIDPDLFPMLNEEPETKRRTRSSEQDPDILADRPEQDPDLNSPNK